MNTTQTLLGNDQTFLVDETLFNGEDTYPEVGAWFLILPSTTHYVDVNSLITVQGFGQRWVGMLLSETFPEFATRVDSLTYVNNPPVR